MGLLALIAGLTIFLAAHVFVTRRGARANAIARLGAAGYRVVFSIASIFGLVLIVWGFALYRQTGWIDLWFPPLWLRHITLLLMWIASVLMLAAYLPGHIKAKTKHPMLAAIKIWAFAHLLANGDLGSMLLFGTMLAWAVYARIAAKKREAIEGRSVVIVSGWRNDAIAVVAGTVLYLALVFAFHPAIIGVPVFGG